MADISKIDIAIFDFDETQAPSVAAILTVGKNL